MAKKIKSYLEQIDNKLITKKKAKLIVDLLNYEIDKNMIINEQQSTIRVDGLISRIIYSDIMFNIILDYPVIIFAKIYKNVDDEYLEIEFEANDVLLETTTETRELKKQVLYTQRLLGGKEIVKDVPHLYRKVLNIYAPLNSNTDSVHYEVLISNVLRDRMDPTKPARLGKTWDPVLMNIKSIVFNSGFLHSLAFENIGEAITQGLLQERDLPKSILEKVLTGDIIEKEKK